MVVRRIECAQEENKLNAYELKKILKQHNVAITNMQLADLMNEMKNDNLITKLRGEYPDVNQKYAREIYQQFKTATFDEILTQFYLKNSIEYFAPAE